MNEILKQKLIEVEKLIREKYALKMEIEKLIREEWILKIEIKKLIKEIEEIEKNEMKEKNT